MRWMRTAVAVLALCALLAGCGERATPRTAVPTATEPTAAVQQLVDDLRANDLAAYARHAVPPPLHAQLDTAWREGRTLWPLTELPLDDRIPTALATLAAPGADRQLRREFDRQFAGADRELHAAATTLGLFGAQYVRNEGDYGPDARAHYAQLIAALGRWGRDAPLGDAVRGRRAVSALVTATRKAKLGDAARWRAEGLDAGLARAQPVLVAARTSLAGYGLDIDRTLAGVRITQVTRSGNRARVRVDYTLGGSAIDAHVDLVRIDGRWYLQDILHAARAEAARERTAALTPPTSQ